MGPAPVPSAPPVPPPGASTPSGSDGRRALNRARTARELVDAAYELMREQGFEAVTAEAVADRAGVSRRTFFNYFSRVELVLRESMGSALAGLIRRFHERPADEPLHESLLAVLAEPFPDDVLEHALVVFGQAAVSRPARAYLLECQEEDLDAVTAALARRMGADGDPLRLQVVARAVVTTGHAAMSAWAERCGGVVDDRTRELHRSLMQQAFRALYETFSAGAVAPAGLAPSTPAEG